MKPRFLQYFSIFMLMMFISNITLANLYTQSSKSDNTKETQISNQKQEKSFWLKFTDSLSNELEEETEEKSENEETPKNIGFQQTYPIHFSFEFQRHLFTTQISEWLLNHAPQLKSKISNSITLSLHRFRL